MADQETVTTLPPFVLEQGFRSLYARLGDVLADPPVFRPFDARTDPGLDAPAGPFALDHDRVRTLRGDLTGLRQDLAPYQRADASSYDERFLDGLSRLRAVLESVYGQRLAFTGERRAAAGSRIRVEQTLQVVAGEATGLRASRVRADADVDIEVSQEVARVEDSGQVTGIDLGEIV
jgi:hypothetical protein